MPIGFAPVFPIAMSPPLLVFKRSTTDPFVMEKYCGRTLVSVGGGAGLAAN